ncbi:hypothetical protein KPA07_12425 [Corynebacterium aurimucosum]|uniref:hypothetical protein n=1 Tax=Corynebacterium aurimucosum TaxID=169292 RepID=UPI001C0EC840|nr:hypothetical protein [Corynebacterium aurimucosum]MBU5655689.1 hypothetical protein [Corynebacterium aurimucosum]
MSEKRAVPASIKVGLPQAKGELPPVPGSQSLAAPVITEAQRKRKGAPADHGHPATKVVGYIALVLTVLMIMVPLYFIFITSFKSFQDVYSDPISFWPNPFKEENYSYVWQTSGFSSYLRNSIIITLILTVVEVVLGVLTAYAFAFIRFPGRNRAWPPESRHVGG